MWWPSSHVPPSWSMWNISHTSLVFSVVGTGSGALRTSSVLTGLITGCIFRIGCCVFWELDIWMFNQFPRTTSMPVCAKLDGLLWSLPAQTIHQLRHRVWVLELQTVTQVSYQVNMHLLFSIVWFSFQGHFWVACTARWPRRFSRNWKSKL